MERIHAPELDGAAAWFNVPAPLTLRALRGKVVLIDFWTYGCINCLHILPDLRRLEEKYRDELVVVGIHSAKFTNERKSENIRRILVRYDIDHPVANDATFAIWKAYGARAWPTQVLIDPEGYVVATASGEGKAEALDRAIGGVVQFFDQRGAVDRRPLPRSLERERLRTSTLAFPGKVAVDEDTGRIVIADSNHHRVLIATPDGQVTDVIGAGTAGFVDGGFDKACLYRPQGVVVDGSRLYVADTENHVVRVADRQTRRVSTLAGTGRQAAWGQAAGPARETPLNSPWDLALVNRRLFIAMAGSHQIWVVDLDRRLAVPYAGSGREARLDGVLTEAAFAQPSGLAIGGPGATGDREHEGASLFVADSESNIIRQVSLPPADRVTTLAGGDLFDFGDRDGTGDAARLQHPLGLTWTRGQLFIADTYNHKIRTLDPATGYVRTWAGTGEEGATEGPRGAATFHEPGGLAATPDALLVADTNNHAIRRVDFLTGLVTTLPIRLS